MNNLFNKLVSLLLVAALLVTFSPTALAAPSRNQGTVKYLSEVALIEAASDEEAQKILTELQKEENGGFTAMISLDLNKGGQKKVYLVYKTSTNVDDAITDLAIMNMDGNFSMGNYEKVLSENMGNFAAIANDYRTIAAEFAAEYAAGNINAKTAYRQMNLYYVEENGVKTYMGDYMLNFPSTNEGFANILFRGNLKIVVNLRDLMAMGIGNGENALARRIADAYAMAETDPSIYSTAAYQNAAQAMKEDLDNMKKDINNLEAEIAKIDTDATMDADQKQLAKDTLQNNLDTSRAFLELLKEIPMGETTLGDYIMDTPVIEANKLFPIAAAGSEAEILLMEYHSLYSMLLYDVLEMSSEDLEAALQELEAGMQPLSVYHGVQNDMVTGTIGVTGDAESYSNSSGKSFFGIYTNDTTQAGSIIFTVMGAGGLASMIGGIAYLNAKINASSAVTKAALQKELDIANQLVQDYSKRIADLKSANKFYANPTNDNLITEYGYRLTNAKKEVVSAQAKLANSQLTAGQIALGSGLILAGAIMIGVSIWQLTELYNKYEISYTDIPDNMVDVVSYDDGDRFVNYKNVPAYYYDNDVLKHRENDLNAYDGRQWVSLYYTKNYEAGYCLTASPDLIATEAGKTGYSSVHLFGRTDNYNANSYCNRENAEAVYLAFKYSTNQKSAVTDVPDIVGSLFNTGVITTSALIGFAAGIGLMAGINKKKLKAAKARA